jgi:hypothetical protein
VAYDEVCGMILISYGRGKHRPLPYALSPDHIGVALGAWRVLQNAACYNGMVPDVLRAQSTSVLPNATLHMCPVAHACCWHLSRVACRMAARRLARSNSAYVR